MKPSIKTSTREQHLIKLFIKFLKLNNKLIPVMLQMKDRGMTFDTLIDDTIKWLSTNFENIDYLRNTPRLHTRVWFFNAIYDSEQLGSLREEWIFHLDHHWMDYWNFYRTVKLRDPKPSKPQRPKEHQEFIDFLKANNALIPFVTNLIHGIHPYTHQHKSVSLTEHLSFHPAHKWIIRAFKWINTPEGAAYWLELYEKWHKRK